MAPPRRRKKKTKAKSAKRKTAGAGAIKKSLKKPARKSGPAGIKTRGAKPARPAKAKSRSVQSRDRKSSGKSGPKTSARRGVAPRQRHLLTSVRRPKAPARRGPSGARTARRRDPSKRPAGGAQGAAGAPLYVLRDFVRDDAAAVNAVALAAFEQFRGEYDDWPAFSAFVGSMADLAQGGELIVAAGEDGIAGAVAYFGPGAAKPDMFDPAWPVIRMLAVDPAARGTGLGRLLTEECIARARRDGASAIALHTSPIMQVALSMYLRLGFVLLRQSSPIFGVPYRIYLKRL